jgi:hypothetical protein
VVCAATPFLLKVLAVVCLYESWFGLILVLTSQANMERVPSECVSNYYALNLRLLSYRPCSSSARMRIER